MFKHLQQEMWRGGCRGNLVMVADRMTAVGVNSTGHNWAIEEVAKIHGKLDNVCQSYMLISTKTL